MLHGIHNASFLSAYSARPLKPALASSSPVFPDSFRLRFAGKVDSAPRYLERDYRAVIKELIELIPAAYRPEVAQAIKGRIIFAPTYADALAIDAQNSSATYCSPFPEEFIAAAEAMHEALSQPEREALRALALNPGLMEAVPVRSASGKQEEANERFFQHIVLSARIASLPKAAIAVLCTIRDMELPTPIAMAFLDMVIGNKKPGDSGYGMYPVEDIELLKSVANAEANNELLHIKESNRPVFMVSTKNYTLEPERIRKLGAHIIATVIILQNRLISNKEFREAFDEDNIERHPQRTINRKSNRQANKSEYLERMMQAFSKRRITEPVMSSDKAEPDIGLLQALINCVTDAFFSTNQYDPEDDGIVEQMYPNLMATVKDRFNLPD